MEKKLWVLAMSAVLAMAMVGIANADLTKKPLVKMVKGKKLCDQGWECKGPSMYCCNETISDYFTGPDFDQFFPMRNSLPAHALYFWDYHSFITAAAIYEPLGFGTTGGKEMGMMEVCAFLGHVGSRTSCGDAVLTGGPLAWGLCYNREMSPSQSYCDEYFKYTYPCAPGAEYYGRGALPTFWNYNYGAIGESLNVDLLNHPEYIEQNATLAFQVAIWTWMTPPSCKKSERIPSAHDAFVGNWKPTKNDTLSKRVPGFGTTMNILYGDAICGKGAIDPMNNLISFFLHFLDLLGVGSQAAGPNEVLSCAEQKPFKSSSTTTTASS